MIEYDLQKYSFTERMVDLWNCLPAYVVRSSSVDILKKNLVKFLNVTKTLKTEVM